MIFVGVGADGDAALRSRGEGERSEPVGGPGGAIAGLLTRSRSKVRLGLPLPSLR